MFELFQYTNPGPYLENEDSFATRLWDNGEVVACVADGVGGEADGELASKFVTSEFIKTAGRNSLEQLASEITALNSSLVAYITINGKKKAFTTLTGIQISENGFLLGAHVGDSRALIFRGNGVLQLTEDHTEANRFLKEGKLTKEQFITYPRKNVLSSAMGMERLLELQVFQYQLKTGDRILLISDGVYGNVSKATLRDLSLESADVETWVSSIANTVLNSKPTDNYTIVAIEYK